MAFPIHPRPMCPAMALPTMGWTFLYQLTIKKISADMSTAQSDSGNRLGEMPSDKPGLRQVESWCLLASLLKCPTFSRVSHAHQASRNIAFCCETLVRLRPLGPGALILEILWGKTYLQWSRPLGMTRFPRGSYRISQDLQDNLSGDVLVSFLFL